MKDPGKIFFFLDYDGTLAPIRKKPSLATIGKSAKAVLKKLAKDPMFRVFIVSGRSLKDIKSRVGLKNAYYIGNHGIEFDGPGFRYILPAAKKLKKDIRKCHGLLKRQAWPAGAFVEDKGYTLSLHYRLVRPDKIGVAKKKFHSIINPLKRAKSVRVTEGKKVLEVRPDVKWDKGKAVKYALRKMNAGCAQVVCMGDDVTDEDAFRALGKKAVNILVSKKPRKTFACCRLESPAEAVKFLKRYTQ